MNQNPFKPTTPLKSLSIAKTMAIVFVVVCAVSYAGVLSASHYLQQKSVSELAVKEARRTSELVFQSLYSVMKKGWTKEEIAEVIGRINHTMPEMAIASVRSVPVAADFGDTEAAAAARHSDPLVRRALESGKEVVHEEEDKITFVYPVHATQDCLSCHVSTPVGGINGAIVASFPVDQLRVPLEFTVSNIAKVFLAVLIGLFVILFLKLRYLVVGPITSLAEHMQEIMASGDLNRRLTRRRKACPYELRTLTQNFNALIASLAEAQLQLEQRSTEDALTGLYNRRKFDELLAREVDRAERYGSQLGLAMIDLDGFKPINDTWGHAAGDEVLVQIADLLRASLRRTDSIARIGGDEFVILIPELDADAFDRVLAKLRAALDDAALAWKGHQLTVGASLGVAHFPADGRKPLDLMHVADQAMYRDKAARKWRRMAEAG